VINNSRKYFSDVLARRNGAPAGASEVANQ
jgi:hypothetical protein